MMIERKRQSSCRHGRWLAALLMLLLGACGGNTSVYFCSGSEEFCSGVRDREEDEDKTAVAAEQALTLARKTPSVIEGGLEADQLKTVAREAPSALGGWLLLTSLGVIVDDGDNAALSGFFDRVRVWLSAEDTTDAADPVLSAGMALLAQLAEERDPAVAEALRARLAGEPMAAAPTPVAEGSRLVPLLAAELETGGDCCSERSLAAASLVLCTTLATGKRQQAGEACAVADRWLTQLLKP